jgi:hypothetical protein
MDKYVGEAVKFGVYNQKTFSGGSMDNPVLLEMIAANIPGETGGTQGSSYIGGNSSFPINYNPEVYTTSPSGIRVNKSGTYLVTGAVYVDEKNQGNTYALGVNGRVDPNLYTTFATTGTGNQRTDITTQLKLNAGDEVSLRLVSQGTSVGKAWMTDGGTPVPGTGTLAMTMVKIA